MSSTSINAFPTGVPRQEHEDPPEEPDTGMCQLEHIFACSRYTYIVRNHISHICNRHMYVYIVKERVPTLK